MPTSQPVCASGSHEMQRPKPIPARIQQACLTMIYGPPGADDPVPLDFVQAAKLAGIRPNILRKWLHKPAVVAFIRRERAAFRVAICAANEYALRKVRDESANGMSVVASVRALQDLSEAEVEQSRNQGVTPGITIHIIQPPAPAIEPQRVAAIEHAPHADAEPVFDPSRPVFNPDR
jgi:hypothetical protein